MTRTCILIVRLALMHLVAGTVLGALMLAARACAVSRAPCAAVLGFRPLHQELLLAGWLLQLVFGVAYWILPRLPDREREADRGRALLATALLNAGVLAAGVGLQLGVAPLAAAGRGMELAGALAFATLAWRRVRPYGLAAAAAGLSAKRPPPAGRA